MTAPLQSPTLIGANPSCTWVDFGSHLVVTFADGHDEIVWLHKLDVHEFDALAADKKFAYLTTLTADEQRALNDAWGPVLAERLYGPGAGERFKRTRVELQRERDDRISGSNVTRRGAQLCVAADRVLNPGSVSDMESEAWG